MKTLCLNFSIWGLLSFTENGMAGKVQNWAMVRNQFVTDDKIKARIEKYEHLIWPPKQVNCDSSIYLFHAKSLNIKNVSPFAIFWFCTIFCQIIIFSKRNHRISIQFYFFCNLDDISFSIWCRDCLLRLVSILFSYR